MDWHTDKESRPANATSQLSIKIFLLLSAKTNSSREWLHREDLSKLRYACACMRLWEYAFRISQYLLSLAHRVLSVIRSEGPIYCILPPKTVECFSNANVSHYYLYPDIPLLDFVRNWSLPNSKVWLNYLTIEKSGTGDFSDQNLSKPRKEESEFFNRNPRKYRKPNP